MLHVEFTDTQNHTWVRINKREARNLYYKGYTIGMLPGNCNPHFMGAPLAHFNLFAMVNANLFLSSELAFNQITWEYELWNCKDQKGWKPYASFYKLISETPAEKPQNVPPIYWNDLKEHDEWSCYK